MFHLLKYFHGRDIETFNSKSIFTEYQNWREDYYINHPKERKQKYKRKNKELKGKTYNKVGPVPINRECRLLVSILKYGKEHKGVLQKTKIPSYTMIKEVRREKILTKDEYLKLKEYFKKTNPYNWLIISFVNHTGIRYPSELNRITWKDVNWSEKYIIIRNRKSKDNILTTSLPLIGRVKEIITELYDRNIEKGYPVTGDFPVFTNEKGIQVKYINKSFKTGLRKCGIDENFRIYDLRHLYTSRMIKRPDIPLKFLSYTLGHTTTNTLEKFYTHLNPKDVIRIFEESEKKKQEILKELDKITSDEEEKYKLFESLTFYHDNEE